VQRNTSFVGLVVHLLHPAGVLRAVRIPPRGLCQPNDYPGFPIAIYNCRACAGRGSSSSATVTHVMQRPEAPFPAHRPNVMNHVLGGRDMWIMHPSIRRGISFLRKNFGWEQWGQSDRNEYCGLSNLRHTMNRQHVPQAIMMLIINRCANSTLQWNAVSSPPSQLPDRL